MWIAREYGAIIIKREMKTVRMPQLTHTHIFNFMLTLLSVIIMVQKNAKLFTGRRMTLKSREQLPVALCDDAT